MKNGTMLALAVVSGDCPYCGETTDIGECPAWDFKPTRFAGPVECRECGKTYRVPAFKRSR